MNKRILFILTAALCATAAAAQQLAHINPQGLSKPATYTHVVKAANLLFIAGQVATDEQGRPVGTTMAEQLDRALSNLEIALKSQGVDWSHVAKTTIFTTSIEEFRAADSIAVRAKHLGQNRPASTLVQIERLADPRFKVEIEAIAVLPGTSSPSR